MEVLQTAGVAPRRNYLAEQSKGRAALYATNFLASGLNHGSALLAQSLHTASATASFRQGRGASHLGSGGGASDGAAAPR